MVFFAAIHATHAAATLGRAVLQCRNTDIHAGEDAIIHALGLATGAEIRIGKINDVREHDVPREIAARKQQARRDP